jgi:hypothetical protein
MIFIQGHDVAFLAAMVERTAKRGNSAGQKFWERMSYPKCSETRQI